MAQAGRGQDWEHRTGQPAGVSFGGPNPLGHRLGNCRTMLETEWARLGLRPIVRSYTSILREARLITIPVWRMILYDTISDS